jgi:molybdate transport system substrate-binding protein
MAAFVANRKTSSTTRMMPVACRAIGILLAGALLGASAVNGAEIRVMTSGAFTAAYLELKPLFEDATRDKIITLATSMGTGRDIPDRLQRGEPVDFVNVDDANLWWIDQERQSSGHEQKLGRCDPALGGAPFPIQHLLLDQS